MLLNMGAHARLDPDTQFGVGSIPRVGFALEPGHRDCIARQTVLGVLHVKGFAI